jgi:type IVB pilus formation R64 PilN family outer membrane protein
MAINPYASLTNAISAMLLDEGQTDVIASEQSGGSDDEEGSGGDAVTATSISSDSGSSDEQQGRSRVVVSPELGVITVTAPPPALDRVASYVDSINQRFARNVLIDLKIYDVSLDDQEGAGFSTDIMFQRLNEYGLEIVSAPTVGFGDNTPGQATLTITDPDSKFNGSQLVGEALSSFGDLSVATSGQVMAVNGQPAPLQIAEEINYLASSSTSITDTVATTSLTPGTRVVGLTANFLPTVQADNRILLQYQLTMSSLLSLDTVSSGGNSIQTPRIASQSVQQQAFVRDGQTIVLFGFEQNRSGMDGNVSLFGASRVATGQRSLRVIVMQIHGGSKDV